MQTHINRSVVPEGDLPVQAVTGERASIVFGEVQIWVDPGDADRIIKAGAEAKRQMDKLRAAGVTRTALPGEAMPSPLSIDCPSCGAPAGQYCTSDFGCTARHYATQVTS